MFLTNKMKGLLAAEVINEAGDYLQALFNIIHKEWMGNGEKYAVTCENIYGVKAYEDWMYNEEKDYKPEVLLAEKAYKKYDWNYKDAVEYAELCGGPLAAFAFLLGKYHGQVGNGGHHQYWDNGYPAEKCSFMGGSSDGNLHEKMCNYFDELFEAGLLDNNAKKFKTIADNYMKKINNRGYNWGGAYGPGDDRMYDTGIGGGTILWINGLLKAEAGSYVEYVKEVA